MFAAALVAVLTGFALALTRALLGPTVFDRALAVNSCGTLAVATLALVGFVTERPDFLDIAILYVLLNVVGTIAVLRFVRFGQLGDPVEGERGGRGADEPG